MLWIKFDSRHFSKVVNVYHHPLEENDVIKNTESHFTYLMPNTVVIVDFENLK